MKKLLLLAALFAVTGIFATEAAVKETILAYRRADAEFDVKMFDYLTADAVMSVAGKNITRQMLKNYVESLKVMLQTDDLELFMEKSLALQGKQMTDAQRQQVRGMKNSDSGKQALQVGKNQIQFLQKCARDGLKAISFKDCSITGDNAKIRVEFLDVTSGTTLRADYTLVKNDGKWLIRGMILNLPNTSGAAASGK